MSWYLVVLSILFFFVGLFIILTDNPVHSILSLVLIFFLSSCLALSLGVEFLAILILIVYVGAISVLFLFVVMLLNIRIVELNVSLVKYWWLGALYSIFFLFNLLYVVSAFFPFNPDLAPVSYIELGNQGADWMSISQFGELVFLYFPHFLILAGLILFVAIVSPVVLSFVTFIQAGYKRPEEHKAQNIFSQTLRVSVDKNF